MISNSNGKLGKLYLILYLPALIVAFAGLRGFLCRSLGNQAAATVTVVDDGTTCSLTIGNAAAAGTTATLTLTGDLTVNTGGTVIVGGTSTTRSATLSVANVLLTGTGIFNLRNTAVDISTLTALGGISMSGTSVMNIGNSDNDNCFHVLNCAGTMNIGVGTTLQDFINKIASATPHFSNSQIALYAIRPYKSIGSCTHDA